VPTKNGAMTPISLGVCGRNFVFSKGARSNPLRKWWREGGGEERNKLALPRQCVRPKREPKKEQPEPHYQIACGKNERSKREERESWFCVEV